MLGPIIKKIYYYIIISKRVTIETDEDFITKKRKILVKHISLHLFYTFLFHIQRRITRISRSEITEIRDFKYKL